MYKIFLISILAILTFGCSRKEVVESAYKNGNPRVVKYYHKKGAELMLDREVVYYENKQKKIEGEYKDQLRTGIWKAWYENGNLWSEGEFKDGKRNGKSNSYHENGKKYIIGMYGEDNRVGAWRFYDTIGALVKEVDFGEVPGEMDRDSLN